jgi:hypothetical protein
LSAKSSKKAVPQASAKAFLCSAPMIFCSCHASEASFAARRASLQMYLKQKKSFHKKESEANFASDSLFEKQNSSFKIH